ncbi:bifunctional diguanylate cyclase/phosphodiesterase [Brevibacillus sp. SYSU BS000544]|uniref:bifunctional diguanylate cyclase/phosphodiesterase n=1 Tax=Brevibacillus sp. SYSU BS000544 TaxID=3416443 RepID=UPI003CE528E2
MHKDKFGITRITNTPVTIFLMLGALFLFLSSSIIWVTAQYKEQLQDNVYKEANVELTTNINALSSSINSRLILTEGLKAFVEAELAEDMTLGDPHFQSYAASIYRDFRGIRNLSVYPEGIGRYVYPLRGNEQVLGINLFKSTEIVLLENAWRTMNTTKMTIVPPRQLVQGGLGMVSRQSIFVEGRFWGFASVVLDVPPIFEEAGFYQANKGITMAVRANKNVFFGDEELFKQTSLIKQVPLPDGHWEIAALPKKERFIVVDQTILFIQLVSFVTLIVFILFLYGQLTQKKRLEKLVDERTQNLLAANHDLESAYEELAATEDTLREQYELLSEQEQALRKSEQQFRELLSRIEMASVMIDMQGKILFCNDYFLHLTGWTLDEVVGKDFRATFQPRRLTDSPFRPVTQDGITSLLDETFVQTRDGKERLLQWHSTYCHGQDGQPVIIAGIGEDITEKKQAEETIYYLAYHDQLSGLPNRALFQEKIEEYLEEAKQSNQKMAVLFLDLDQFKMINDTLGHAFGDQLLREVGQRLTSGVSDHLFVARIGGDEFTMIIPNITGMDQVHQMAQSILDLFQQPIFLNDQEFFITTSIGVTIFPDSGDSSTILIKNADVAMYRAKELGKNGYQIYDKLMNTDSSEQMNVINSLRKALSRDEFTVFYQPQIGTRNRKIVGLEALIRWHHPERGMIPPVQFIPIAEESGLIVPIGEWVLRTVCNQIKTWQDQGFPATRVAVNLSARQLKQNNFADVVRSILEETKLDPTYLELEITENMAMVDSNLATLHELKDMGITISIDDFGTHYSSLSYLKSLPVHKIKIDRSFVNGICNDPKDETIILAMLLVAKNLNLESLAEGVETSEQMAFLQEHHCDVIQGYYFYKPVPATDVEEIMRIHLAEENGR